MGIIDINLDKVVESGAKLLGKFIQDKDKAAQLAHDIATMGSEHAQSQVMAQLKINEESAKHPSMFVSGARPAAIWVCVTALSCMLVIFPLVTFACGVMGKDVVMPPVDTATMFGVLGPLLGLGAMRTGEKIKGVARSNLRSNP